jgi:muconolactone delta-isomerase
MYVSGSLRSIWRRKDTPGAAILFEAASEDEARTLASSLPLAQRGMIEFPLITQLEPYPGFGPR